MFDKEAAEKAASLFRTSQPTPHMSLTMAVSRTGARRQLRREGEQPTARFQTADLCVSGRGKVRPCSHNGTFDFV